MKKGKVKPEINHEWGGWTIMDHYDVRGVSWFCAENMQAGGWLRLDSPTWADWLGTKREDSILMIVGF